jgi:ribosomal protein S18 acetylase RimI-like enzyme
MRWQWTDRCASIGMVIVAPEHQGKGVGRRLMQALIDAEPATSMMLSATAAGLDLYGRLGFCPIGNVVQYQGIFAAPALHPSLRVARHTDLPALIALDRAAFGPARARLIERLMVEGEGRVVERRGRLCGFAFKRRFGRGETVGPLVAETEEDAITLAAGTLGNAFQRIDIPAQATALGAWLTEANLAPVDRVTVMTRGTWPPSSGAMQRFALAAQAVG